MSAFIWAPAPTKTYATRIDEERWESLREAITAYYREHTAIDTLGWLQRTQEFPVTHAQLRRQLDKWGVKKYGDVKGMANRSTGLEKGSSRPRSATKFVDLKGSGEFGSVNDEAQTRCVLLTSAKSEGLATTMGVQVATSHEHVGDVPFEAATASEDALNLRRLSSPMSAEAPIMESSISRDGPFFNSAPFHASCHPSHDSIPWDHKAASLGKPKCADDVANLALASAMFLAAGERRDVFYLRLKMWNHYTRLYQRALHLNLASAMYPYCEGEERAAALNCFYAVDSVRQGDVFLHAVQQRMTGCIPDSMSSLYELLQHVIRKEVTSNPSLPFVSPPRLREHARAAIDHQIQQAGPSFHWSGTFEDRWTGARSNDTIWSYLEYQPTRWTIDDLTQLRDDLKTPLQQALKDLEIEDVDDAWKQNPRLMTILNGVVNQDLDTPSNKSLLRERLYPDVLLNLAFWTRFLGADHRQITISQVSMYSNLIVVVGSVLAQVREAMHTDNQGWLKQNVGSLEGLHKFRDNAVALLEKESLLGMHLRLPQSSAYKHKQFRLTQIDQQRHHVIRSHIKACLHVRFHVDHEGLMLKPPMDLHSRPTVVYTNSSPSMSLSPPAPDHEGSELDLVPSADSEPSFAHTSALVQLEQSLSEVHGIKRDRLSAFSNARSSNQSLAHLAKRIMRMSKDGCVPFRLSDDFNFLCRPYEIGHLARASLTDSMRSCRASLASSMKSLSIRDRVSVVNDHQDT